MDGMVASNDGTSNTFDLKSMFDQKDYFDITVQLSGNRTINCHRAVIAPQSRKFATNIRTQYRSKTATIDLTGEDDEEAAYAMVAWTYSYKYNRNLLDNDKQLQWHIRMHKLAHKYGIDKLITETLSNIQNQLRAAGIDIFLVPLRKAYESSGESGEQLVKMVNELLVLRLRDLVSKEEFWAVIRDHPGQSRGIIQRFAEEQAMEMDVCEFCGS